MLLLCMTIYSNSFFSALCGNSGHRIQHSHLSNSVCILISCQCEHSTSLSPSWNLREWKWNTALVLFLHASLCITLANISTFHLSCASPLSMLLSSALMCSCLTPWLSLLNNAEGTNTSWVSTEDRSVETLWLSDSSSRNTQMQRRHPQADAWVLGHQNMHIYGHMHR